MDPTTPLPEKSNPVTGQIYETDAERLDSLVDSWSQVLREEYEVNRKKKLLMAAIDTAVGNPGKTSGTVRALGINTEVKVVRRENVKYEKEAGAEHPLLTLVRKHRWLSNMITLDVREKSEIPKMIASPNGAEQAEVAEIISKIRVVSQGSPTIEVSDRKA